LSKILALILNPVFILILFLISCLFTSTSTNRLKRKLALISFLILIYSNQWISNALIGKWEKRTIPSLTKISECQTAIVLGGFSHYDKTIQKITFSNNSDRILQSMALLGSNQINRLLISSGSGYVLDTTQKESIFVRDYLVNVGFDKSSILIDSVSRNTNENAIETKKILSNLQLDKKLHLLITSASHLRRAQACFNKNGLNTIAYPTDFKYDSNMSVYDMLIPSIKGMEKWNILIHEVVGHIVYKIVDYS